MKDLYLGRYVVIVTSGIAQAAYGPFQTATAAREWAQRSIEMRNLDWIVSAIYDPPSD